MKALFVELPAFARFRADYLDDEGFRDLQAVMMKHPEAGDVIEGTGVCASCVTATGAGARASVADYG